MGRPEKSIEVLKEDIFPALNKEWKKTLEISRILNKNPILLRQHLNKLWRAGLIRKTEIHTGKRMSFAWKLSEVKEDGCPSV